MPRVGSKILISRKCKQSNLEKKMNTPINSTITREKKAGTNVFKIGKFHPYVATPYQVRKLHFPRQHSDVFFLTVNSRVSAVCTNIAKVNESSSPRLSSLCLPGMNRTQEPNSWQLSKTNRNCTFPFGTYSGLVLCDLKKAEYIEYPHMNTLSTNMLWWLYREKLYQWASM